MTATNKPPKNTPLRRWQRIAYVVLGCFFVLLGFIGAVLPVMPTTVFLIAAAWAFGKSSPRLENWLLHHPKFGPVLIAWRETGAIPRKAKMAACCGITLGFIIFYLTAHMAWWLTLIVFCFMLATAIWIIKRPEPDH